MATHTISGSGYLPDGVTPLDGFWHFRLHTSNGAAVTDTGVWRGGEQIISVRGPATITLPATTGSEIYEARFATREKKHQFLLGPYYFTLTADKLWTDVIETPVGGDISPTIVQQITTLLNAEATPTDVIVTALINSGSSQVRAALQALFLRQVGSHRVTVSNTQPSSPAVGDIWFNTAP